MLTENTVKGSKFLFMNVKVTAYKKWCYKKKKESKEKVK